MQVVDKGIAYGRPDTDWVSGAKVGDPHPALVMDRWFDIDTEYGPLYFIRPTVETMGKHFGMLREEEALALQEELAAVKADLEEERRLRMIAELDLDNFKSVLERRFSTTTAPGGKVKK